MPQLSLFFDILLCMARNVSREDFLAGQPPEIGQGDTDVAGYLQSARAELWRELRDQPLTMGGYCLSALQGGETMGVRTPRMRLLPTWPLGLLDQAGLVHLPEPSFLHPQDNPLPFFLLSHSSAPVPVFPISSCVTRQVAEPLWISASPLAQWSHHCACPPSS